MKRQTLALFDMMTYVDKLHTQDLHRSLIWIVKKYKMKNPIPRNGVSNTGDVIQLTYVRLAGERRKQRGIYP